MTEKQLRVLEVAKFIIVNKATIEKTANKFGLSISSIKKYINIDLPLIDVGIYKAVKMVQQGLINEGVKKGGTIGKRQPKYSEFESLEMAETIIKEGLTLKDASIKFNVPKSSIHNRIRDIEDEEIQSELDKLYERRKIR